MGLKTTARLAILAVVSAAALIGGGGAASADPPKGWAPTADSTEYDYAWVTWEHHGRYADAPGNWHGGGIVVEEDDDGVQGPLIDWTCPRGVKPPADPFNVTATKCKVERSRWIDTVRQNLTLAQMSSFDQAHNRILMHNDYWTVDDNDDKTGSVRIDLTLQGLGKPTIQKQIYGEHNEFLDYGEFFHSGKAWGKVDGHRISGPHTTTTVSEVAFLDTYWHRTS